LLIEDKKLLGLS